MLNRAYPYFLFTKNLNISGNKIKTINIGFKVKKIPAVRIIPTNPDNKSPILSATFKPLQFTTSLTLSIRRLYSPLSRYWKSRLEVLFKNISQALISQL